MKTRVVQMSDGEFRELRGQILDRAGIAVQDGKRYVLESRLSSRLEALGLDSFGEYARFLRIAPSRLAEFQELLTRVTVNEGCFLRHRHQLEIFERVTLSGLIAARSRVRRLRLWSAGCGTGEEAYTLAIMIARALGERLDRWDVGVLGTDICASALERGRSGRYGEASFRSTPSSWRAAHFVEHNGSWAAGPLIRGLVRFESHNLLDGLGARRLGEMDAILCRDTLIHFDASSRRAAVDVLHDRLAPDGALYLGPSETLSGVDAGFESIGVESAHGYVKRPEGVRRAA